MDSAAGSHVLSRPVPVGWRLLSSIQHLRSVGTRLRRLLVRRLVYGRVAVLSQVPDVQDLQPQQIGNVRLSRSSFRCLRHSLSLRPEKKLVHRRYTTKFIFKATKAVV